MGVVEIISVVLLLTLLLVKVGVIDDEIREYIPNIIVHKSKINKSLS